MAELHHVIGAILRDIAQARVTSDLYTRDVSRYYEQDSLLRIFPVPRSEISEVNIDLRFAISRIEPDPDRTTEKNAKTAGIMEPYSERLVNSIFDGLTSTPTAEKGIITVPPPAPAPIPTPPTPPPPEIVWLDVINYTFSPDFRSALRTKIVDCFESSVYGLIDPQNNLLDVEALLDLLKDVVDASIYQKAEIAAFMKDSDFSGPIKTAVTTRMKSDLESMRVEIEFVRRAAEDYIVEVDVTSDKLQEVPEAALSSIKLTTSMRNYTWSQVEQKDERIIRRLIPE